MTDYPPDTGPAGAALLAAVLAEPDDLGRRLVLADQWEESGFADHAAFVRAMVELDTTTPMPAGREFGLAVVTAGWLDGRRWGPFAERLFGRNYARQNCCQWVQYDYRTGEVVAWSGGFIEEVRLTWPKWEEYGDEILRRHPVMTVEVVGRPGFEIEAAHGQDEVRKVSWVRWGAVVSGRPFVRPCEIGYDKFVHLRLGDSVRRRLEEIEAARPTVPDFLRQRWPAVKKWVITEGER